MTDVTEGPGGPADHVGPQARSDRSARDRSRWWGIGYPAVIAVACLLVPLLGWLGIQTILGSTEGTAAVSITDPAAPGYERLVDPTPTGLVVALDAEGELSSVAFLALTGEDAGGVVVIPPATLITDGEGGGGTLEATWRSLGEDGVRQLVERQLNADIAEADVRVVRHADWAALVAPVAPLRVDNPDPVVDGEGATAFASGTVTVAADEVGDLLSLRNPDETDLNRMVRIQAFWRSWLEAVGEAGDREDVVPGEVDSGLGRFVRALGGSRVEVATLPVEVAPLPGSDAAVFAPIHDEVALLVTRIVPFPVGAPPGARLRVRLLDGAGGLDHGVGAVRPLTAAGAEISSMGNASELGVATTRIVYHDEALLDRVEVLAAALGVGSIERSAQVDDAIDVTVVLGEDARAGLGEGEITITAAPPGPGAAPTGSAGTHGATPPTDTADPAPGA